MINILTVYVYCCVSGMVPGHYEDFLALVEMCFDGFEFQDNIRWLRVDPFCLAAYDLLGSGETESARGKYLSRLPPEFISSANSELYRSKRGWISRGVEEDRLITYSEADKQYIVPKLSTGYSVGIDSSSNTFAVCFFDNHLGGIRYLERHLDIPRSSEDRNKEFHWQKLNRENRQKMHDNLERVLNISCRGVLAINTNLINSGNRLTHNQMAGLIDGCFSGYDNDPTQNQQMRQVFRERFFGYGDGIPTHCDPDFQKLDPSDIVRILVRQLSYKYGSTRECTPAYATLQSHESLPIQLADVLVGCISRKIMNGESPPMPLDHLFFDTRRISRKDRRKGRVARGFYWFRGD